MPVRAGPEVEVIAGRGYERGLERLPPADIVDNDHDIRWGHFLFTDRFFDFPQDRTGSINRFVWGDYDN
jgi:hypothetical protein